MKNAKYIAFEGVEGIGKTFLLNKFIEKYGTAKYYLIGEELDGFAESIFSAVIDKDGRYMHKHPVSEMLCFFAMDLYGIETNVMPALAEGKIVLQDRGADTSCLYAAIDLFLKGEIEDVIECYKNFLGIRERLGKIPELSIVFVGDFETALKRAEGRDKRKYGKEERRFLEIADKYFRKLAEKFPERIRILDISGRDAEDIIKEIKQIVDEL
ncbi:hypothetical protein HZB88_02510 [archaeon]|nr:hypothetical protein [archaeon]